jgi:putative MATE family efflux protein
MADRAPRPAARARRAAPWRRSQWDREIARLAVPAFGALVAEPLYILADTAVVGHLGTPQLAGLAVASTVISTAYSLFIFLAYGTTAAVARLIGAGDEREAARQAVQSIWLAMLISAVLLPAGVLAAGALVHAVGATGPTAGYAVTYLRISLIGLPAYLVTMAATGYLRGHQDTRTPLVLAVGSAVFNLVLELILIYGLGYGIGASAASTALAQTGAAAAYLVRVGRAARRWEAPLRPDPRSVRRLARVGIALAVRTAALLSAYTLATAIAARLGSVPVAAHQVAIQVWYTLALGLDAIAIAGQAMVGRLLGAGDTAGARSVSGRMVQLGIGMGVLFGAVVAAAHGVLPHVFSDDPAVVALAGFLLLWAAAAQPVNAVVFVLDGVLMGAGDMRFLAVAMVGAVLLFAATGSVLLILHLGVGWLWAALTLLILARMVALVGRLRTDRWLVVGAVR